MDDPGKREPDSKGKEQEVNEATDTLDDLSERLPNPPISPTTRGSWKLKDAKKLDPRSTWDDNLKKKEALPHKLWPDVKSIYFKELKGDKALVKELNAAFNQDLRDKLENWEEMVTGGKVDRAEFLKADETIADIISSYDTRLERIAQGRAGNRSDRIFWMREALHAIAGYMSYQTKYINEKGLWK